MANIQWPHDQLMPSVGGSRFYLFICECSRKGKLLNRGASVALYFGRPYLTESKVVCLTPPYSLWTGTLGPLTAIARSLVRRKWDSPPRLIPAGQWNSYPIFCVGYNLSLCILVASVSFPHAVFCGKISHSSCKFCLDFFFPVTSFHFFLLCLNKYFSLKFQSS